MSLDRNGAALTFGLTEARGLVLDRGVGLRGWLEVPITRKTMPSRPYLNLIIPEGKEAFRNRTKFKPRGKPQRQTVLTRKPV
jgi:hypothetical protein